MADNNGHTARLALYYVNSVVIILIVAWLFIVEAGQADRYTGAQAARDLAEIRARLDALEGDQ